MIKSAILLTSRYAPKNASYLFSTWLLYTADSPAFLIRRYL